MRVYLSQEQFEEIMFLIDGRIDNLASHLMCMHADMPQSEDNRRAIEDKKKEQEMLHNLQVKFSKQAR